MKNLRKLLLLLLVLAFTGQGVVATALPCQMPMNVEAMAGATDMAAMDHTGHHMPVGALEAAASDSDGSCCDVGLCAAGHCQSAAALPLHHQASSAEYATVFAYLSAVAPPIRFNDSLYRPPIFR